MVSRDVLHQHTNEYGQFLLDYDNSSIQAPSPETEALDLLHQHYERMIAETSGSS